MINLNYVKKIIVDNEKEFANNNYDIEISVQFSTNISDNTAEVKIYNLDIDTINYFEVGQLIEIKVGYENEKDIRDIFYGSIKKIIAKTGNDESVIEIICNQNIDNWQNKEINITYDKRNISAKIILADLINQIGLPIAEIVINKDKAYKLGKTFNGNLKEVITEIINDLDCKFYIKNGAIYILSNNLNENIIVPINNFVSKPHIINKEAGIWEIETLLNNNISAGTMINIQNDFVNGIYKVVSGEHTAEFNTVAQAIKV